jgi:hypothetical protein
MSSLTRYAMSHTPLPAKFIHSPQALAVWIDAVAPCVVGAQSKDTYNTIFEYLVSRGVNLETIATAFTYSQDKWTTLSVTHLDLSIPLGPAMTPQTSMGPTTTDRVTEAEVLARNLDIAINTDDVQKRNRVLRALQNLFTQMNKDQFRELIKEFRSSSEYNDVFRYFSINPDGSVTFWDNLLEFDEEDLEGEGEAAP